MSYISLPDRSFAIYPEHAAFFLLHFEASYKKHCVYDNGFIIVSPVEFLDSSQRIKKSQRTSMAKLDGMPISRNWF